MDSTKCCLYSSSAEYYESNYLDAIVGYIKTSGSDLCKHMTVNQVVQFYSSFCSRNSVRSWVNGEWLKLKIPSFLFVYYSVKH